MKRTRTIFAAVSLVVLAATSVTGCGGSSSKDDKDDATPATGGGGTQATPNPLAAAFPGSLALSVFPLDSATTLALNTADETEVAPPSATVSEKIAANARVVSGEAERCFDPSLFRRWRRTTVNCYEFDSDMNPFMNANNTKNFGTKDGTNGSGEACLVAFTRDQVQDAVQIVDQALGLVSGMLCQAKKDGLATELPDVGEKLDLAMTAGRATGAEATVRSGSMTRLADADSRPVYKSEITIARPDGETTTVNLVHSPGTGDESSGNLWVSSSGGTRPIGNGPTPPNGGADSNNTANKNRVMSINYSRTTESGAPRIRYEVRRAQIVNTVEAFTDSGLVNYAAVGQNAANSEIHAINYVAFDLNPETNAGKLAYWQNPGGSYNESARGFLFDVVADATTGELSGCGVSGATANVSIRKSLAEPSTANTLKPVRYLHPFAAQNVSPDKDARYVGSEGPKITKQCFKQNSAGVYAIDTAVTTDAAGYSVIETDAAGVEPPRAPDKKLEGSFRAPPTP